MQGHACACVRVFSAGASASQRGGAQLHATAASWAAWRPAGTAGAAGKAHAARLTPQLPCLVAQDGIQPPAALLGLALPRIAAPGTREWRGRRALQLQQERLGSLRFGRAAMARTRTHADSATSTAPPHMYALHTHTQCKVHAHPRRGACEAQMPAVQSTCAQNAEARTRGTLPRCGGR